MWIVNVPCMMLLRRVYRNVLSPPTVFRVGYLR